MAVLAGQLVGISGSVRFPPNFSRSAAELLLGRNSNGRSSSAIQYQVEA